MADRELLELGRGLDAVPDVAGCRGRGPWVCAFPTPAATRARTRWTCPDCGTHYRLTRPKPERWWRRYWSAPDGHWVRTLRTPRTPDTTAPTRR